MKGHNWGLCRKCGRDHGLPPFLGKHHSEKTREKMSVSKRGQNHNFYGRHHSYESRMRISESLSDERHPFYGRHHSNESKRKISDARRGEWADPEIRAKRVTGMNSSDARAKNSEKKKEDWANGTYSGVFVSPTSIETMVREYLDDHSIPYSTGKVINIGYKTRKPDTFIEPNIIIESDGAYYHGENNHGNNKKAEDEKGDKILKKMGYIVYRIPEADFRNGKYQKTLNMIVDKHKP